MATKKKALSPAKQREADIKAAAPINVSPSIPEWASWETKVDRISSRSTQAVIRGWMAHIPQISPPGTPPGGGLSDIAAVAAVFPLVPKKGDMIESLSGARSAVLHESIYLLHKAIHVQVTCANGIDKGRHTWAVVDAYQASLFALASIMGLLGLTVERSNNDFILIDVWEPVQEKVSDITKRRVENYKFIRFKALDHFHKWAILKRLLRALTSRSPLANFILDAIENSDVKEFALHRNTVHYQSCGWIANDLVQDDMGGPISPAQSAQEMYDEIYDGSEAGTVFLMCALVEFACEIANGIFEQGVLSDERALMERRVPARNILTKFDWNTIV